MVRLGQTIHLSYTDSNTVSKEKEVRFQMTHTPKSSIRCVENDLRAYSMFDANHAYILCQDYHYVQKDQNKLPLEPRHLMEPSSASKMIFKPMVRLAQIMHLDCTDNNTISKWKVVRFHMTHVT
jgi:hypothetical protein